MISISQRWLKKLHDAMTSKETKKEASIVNFNHNKPARIEICIQLETRLIERPIAAGKKSFERSRARLLTQFP